MLQSTNQTAAFRWEDIDHSLVKLKFCDLVDETSGQGAADERSITFKNLHNLNSSTAPHQVLEMKEQRTDEWAQRLYEVYCEVWNVQGKAKSAAFVRAVLARVILPSLQRRARSSERAFQEFVKRSNFPAQVGELQLKGFRLRMGRLQDRWRRRLEAEAKECEHAERRNTLIIAEQHPGFVQPSVIDGRGDLRQEAALNEVEVTSTTLSVRKIADKKGRGRPGDPRKEARGSTVNRTTIFSPHEENLIKRATLVEKIRHEIIEAAQALELPEDYDQRIHNNKSFANFTTVRVCNRHGDLREKLCAIKMTRKPNIIKLACEIASRSGKSATAKPILPGTFEDAHKRYGKIARERSQRKK
jgi:hypothetical protein